MKVILLQEVKGRGGEGDVVDVARGYAVNYLYPKKIAVEATKGNLKQLEARKHNIEKREAQRLDTADKLMDALNEKSVIVKARVGEEGQLFGSVTTAQISEAIAAQIGADIDRKKIDLHKPIKTAGEHSATISIYRETKAILTIVVVDEKSASNDIVSESTSFGDDAHDSESRADNSSVNDEADTDISDDINVDTNAEIAEPAEETVLTDIQDDTQEDTQIDTQENGEEISDQTTAKVTE